MFRGTRALLLAKVKGGAPCNFCGGALAFPPGLTEEAPQAEQLSLACASCNSAYQLSLSKALDLVRAHRFRCMQCSAPFEQPPALAAEVERLVAAGALDPLQEVTCPGCARSFAVPLESAEVDARCPTCGKRFRARGHAASAGAQARGAAVWVPPTPKARPARPSGRVAPSGPRERAPDSRRSSSRSFEVTSASRAADPYAPPASAEDPRHSPPPAVRPSLSMPWRAPPPPRDVLHEGHVVALAIWQYLSGAGFAAGGVVVLAVSQLPHPLRGGVGFGLIVVGALCVALGYGLRRMHNWARLVYGALTVLGILLQLFALVTDPAQVPGAVTSIAMYLACLWVLFGERGAPLFDPAYQAVLPETGIDQPWARSPFFWLPLLGLLCLGGTLLLGVPLDGAGR
ncbi:MAG: hypothetical protein R3F62_30035 [Planctomycetota bacterium]